MRGESDHYHVFLCHNGRDRASIQAVEREVRAQGVRCWLDTDELLSGTRWLNFITSDWPRIGSLAVFLGPNGLGDGQRREIEELVPLALRDRKPVIPVLLPTLDKEAEAKTIVPGSLIEMVYVDMRVSASDSIARLVAGIRGKNPDNVVTLGALYRPTDRLKGEKLAEALCDITSRGHRRLHFPQRVRLHVEALFEDAADPDRLLLFPDGLSVPKANHYGVKPQRGPDTPIRWSMDMVWPRAFGFRNCRIAMGDLHNIVPTNIRYNSQRGAGAFYDADLDDLKKEMALSAEVEGHARGIVARACMYMAVRYRGRNGDPHLLLDEEPHVIGKPHLGSLNTLLYWNKLERPSKAEYFRNRAIAERQGNRNPFVDRPDFADRVWHPPGSTPKNT